MTVKTSLAAVNDGEVSPQVELLLQNCIKKLTTCLDGLKTTQMDVSAIAKTVTPAAPQLKLSIFDSAPTVEAANQMVKGLLDAGNMIVNDSQKYHFDPVTQKVSLATSLVSLHGVVYVFFPYFIYF